MPREFSKCLSGFDHIVAAVTDLDESAAFCRSLGFTISPRGVHHRSLGTANHTIMLEQDYFEILHVVEPTLRNLPWRNAVQRGGGLAGFAFATDNAGDPYSSWRDSGLTPSEIHAFARPVQCDDGSIVQARFETVTLEATPERGARPFACAQLTREAVWLPSLMIHDNTAVGIRCVTLASRDPTITASEWQRILPHWSRNSEGDSIILSCNSQFISVESGEFWPNFDSTFFSAAVAIEFLVRNIEAARFALKRGSIAFQETGDGLQVLQPNPIGALIKFRSR